LSDALAHLSASGIAQITSAGGSLQAKNSEITLDISAQRQPRIRAALDAGHIRGAYLHVPFCFHKCHYCDFYSIVDSQDRQEPFVRRLIAEIEAISPRIERPLETIFIGGGTPTLLHPNLWRRLLVVIRERLPLAAGGEFTIEANPETVTPELVEVLASGGVNRVSIGAQSFNPAHLKALERWHDPASVARSVQFLRGSGISNINLDLIFAIPGQTLDTWRSDLESALALHPSHVSCYGLMYESNTPLTQRLHMGEVQAIDEDDEAAMYEATLDVLGAAGFEQYEISNWARDGATCRHNLLYWRNANWWALGPSASGHVSGVRWKNIPRLSDYLNVGPLPPVTDVEFVDDPTRAGERFMLGLRLNEGLSLAEVEALLSLSGGRADARRAALQRHRAAGLLAVHDQRLVLTRRGRLLANDVLVDLI
jgi:oxygen-independent coproporphyrinogen III oxidase